jgi:hypothetical protein
MLRRLLAIAAPLSLAAAGHAPPATPPGHASIPAAGAAARVSTGLGPHGATALTRASTPTAIVPDHRPGGPGPSVASTVAAPAASPRSAGDSPLFGSNADAINIDPLGTCIGCTGAGAAPRDSSSYSRSIRVADESLAEDESPANGYTSGSILGLPPNSLLALAIGTWHADNRHDATSAEGHSYANAGELAVGDGTVASLVLFEAQSDASRSPHGHHASGSSNAVHASLVSGQVMLIVLHSDSSSDGPGHVYVAQVNQNQLMTSDELSGGQPATVPKVATLNLLRTGSEHAVVFELADGQSNGAAEIVSTSTGNTSGPRNQTH